MAETIEQLIQRIAQEEGVDPNLAIAIAKQESGLNPKAYNGNGESSVGLFQLNQNGGMGSGHARATLEDPEFNARIALKALARTQAQNPTLDPGSLAAASQRPADARGYARSINAMVTGGRGLPHTGSPFSPMGGSQTVANPLIDTITKEIESLGRERDIAISNAQAQREGATVLRERLPVLDTEYASSTERAAYNAAVKEVESREKEAERFEAEADRLRTQISTQNQRLASEQMKEAASASKDSEPRVVGRALVDAQGNVIYRDPTETSQKAGFHQVDTGTEVIILDDTGAELRRIPKQRDVKYGTDPSTGATFIMNPDGTPGQKIFEGKGATPTTTTAGNRVFPNDPTTGLPRVDQAVDLRTPEQQQLDSRKAEIDLLTSQIALGWAQQTQAALDAALALPPGSVDRRQALQRVTMEAARYSDPQVILREAELEATKQRDAENLRSNKARELETSQQNTLTGALTLGRDIGTRQKNLADAQTNFEQYGVATPGRLANLSAMGKEVPLQSEVLMTLMQRLGVDPNSPRGQGALQAYGQSFVTEPDMSAMQTPPVQPPVPQPNPSGQTAAVFGGQPQPQAFDLAGIGNAGWGQALTVQDGIAEAVGSPYDIPEEGEQAVAAGPPPADIASVIEQLGFKRKQLQTA